MTGSLPPDGLVPMRLQRFLARAGVASRRGSEDLMTAGRVTVNGVTVRELGSKVDPARDAVAVDGRPVLWGAPPVYLMLNKPSGVLTTMSDPHGRPCVAGLVPVAEHPGLFPVGRLDRDTTGLLLFTTDGDAAQALLHPSFMKEKRYVALVRGRARDTALAPLRRGIVLDDGPCAPAKASVLKPGSPLAATVAPGGVPYNRSVVELRVHEGRKHIVKRMLAEVGLPVERLHRYAFGPLRLRGLAPGQWRYLEPEETDLLLKEARPATKGGRVQ